MSKLKRQQGNKETVEKKKPKKGSYDYLGTEDTSMVIEDMGAKKEKNGEAKESNSHCFENACGLVGKWNREGKDLLTLVQSTQTSVTKKEILEKLLEQQVLLIKAQKNVKIGHENIKVEPRVVKNDEYQSLGFETNEVFQNVNLNPFQKMEQEFSLEEPFRVNFETELDFSDDRFSNYGNDEGLKTPESFGKNNKMNDDEIYGMGNLEEQVNQNDCMFADRQNLWEFGNSDEC